MGDLSQNLDFGTFENSGPRVLLYCTVNPGIKAACISRTEARHFIIINYIKLGLKLR